jgi:hypothetical protein
LKDECGTPKDETCEIVGAVKPWPCFKPKPKTEEAECVPVVLNDLLPLLEYHEAAASDGRKDYAAMCEDGDDTYLCGVLLSLAEQHEKFAATLRRIIEAG